MNMAVLLHPTSSRFISPLPSLPFLPPLPHPSFPFFLFSLNEHRECYEFFFFLFMNVAVLDQFSSWRFGSPLAIPPLCVSSFFFFVPFSPFPFPSLLPLVSSSAEFVPSMKTAALPPKLGFNFATRLFHCLFPSRLFSSLLFSSFLSSPLLLSPISYLLSPISSLLSPLSSLFIYLFNSFADLPGRQGRNHRCHWREEICHS